MSDVRKDQIASWLKRFRLYGVATSLLELRSRLRFRLADDVGAVAIGDAEADFRVTTPNEFSTVSDPPEEAVVADVLSSLRPDDVFYDVGANIGVYSCLAASVVETEVLAFEPEPRNAARLRENARLNDADVDVYEVALSEANETREFGVMYFDGAHQTGPAGHSFVQGGSDVAETISVESVIGDDFIEERDLPKPTVMKIDVEGAEWGVLSGLESTLSDPGCRLVYCELHRGRLEAQGRSVEDVEDELSRLGFDVETPFAPYGEAFIRASKSGTGDPLESRTPLRERTEAV